MTARWLLELLITVWMPYAPKSLRSTPVPVDLFNLLTGPELLEMTETYQPRAPRAAVSTHRHVVDVHEAGAGRGSLLR